nr:hypothetical protein 2 [Piscirickettsiaceae bacterium]
MSTEKLYQPGVYKVTKGQFIGAAVFMIDMNEAEENVPAYVTIYNPDSEENHEISMPEWHAMLNEDGLERVSDIPDEIKDKCLSGGLGFIKGL